MFTQKKKNYQTFLYVTIVATLCFLVLALLWPRETPKEQPVDLSSAALHKESEEEGAPLMHGKQRMIRRTRRIRN